MNDSDVGAEWIDVAALHAEARTDLWQSCERARRGRAQVLAVVGPAGTGKSHLLVWLRQRLALRGDPQTFVVAMPALPDLAQPFRHALRQLVGALCRSDSAPAAGPESADDLLARPIDRVMWEALFNQSCDLLDAARVGVYQGQATLLKLLGPMCHDAGRKRPLSSFAQAAQKVWPQVEPGLRSYLLSLPTEMSIDSAARAVFLQFPYADRRALCTAWLAGEELSQKDRERISAKQVINNENAAKYVLSSLVRLLTMTPGSQLVILYDQTQQLVEQLGQPGIAAMSEVATAIHGSGGSTLQVLSLQPTTYGQLQDRPGRPTLSGQARHIDKTLQLGPVNPEVLRELVTARLAAGLPDADDRPTPLYPLTEADLAGDKWPKEADTPRGALQAFAARYSQRKREILPNSATSARNAPSTPDQRRASGPTRKDGPSAPGIGRRTPPSTLSPSLDFLSQEETGDAKVEPVPPGGASARPRSLTHPDESGATTAPNRPAPRPAQPFIADSSPTIQALPKDVVAAALMPSSAKARDLAREAKLTPSFVADSSPTVQALTDDVMGKVRSGAAINPRMSEAAAKPAPGSTAASSLRAAAKAADKPPEAARKSAEKSAPSRPAPVVSAKTAGPTPTPAPAAKQPPVDAHAAPNFEADSSPTLKQTPDESLIRATRDRSRPHNGPMLARMTPMAASDSGVIGRTTPTVSVQPALVSASRASSGPSKPPASEKPAGEKAATKPPLAKLPPTEVAPPAPSNVPDPLPPSADSPSMGWLAMANDQDPLADAIKQAKADLGKPAAAKPPADLVEPPRPTPGSTPPAPPASAPAAPKTAQSAVTAKAVTSRPPAAKAVSKPPLAAASRPPAEPAPAKSGPIPATAPMVADGVPTELPPSAESPSMGWLAMASGSSQLEDAVAQAKADLQAAPPAGDNKPAVEKAERGESGPTAAARAARPMRAADGLGVVVVNRATVKAPEPAAEEAPAEPAPPRAPVRSTQARLPAIQLRTSKSVSPQQVLAALSGRGMMEEWQLAQDLGIAPDALDKILTALEDEGQIRLMPIEDGQRMVVRID